MFMTQAFVGGSKFRKTKVELCKAYFGLKIMNLKPISTYNVYRVLKT
jgi:hypothetical protein